jgi:Type VI secretion system/phage-baseplate injector OB domain
MRRTQVSAVSDGTDAPKGHVKILLVDLGLSTESDWTPFPGVFGGSGQGIWFPPKVGTRCVYFFADDDEEQRDPIIVCAYYDDVMTHPGDDIVKPALEVGGLRVTLNGSSVALEVGGSTYKLARADKVEAEINAIINSFNSHHHLGTGAFGAVTAADGVIMPASAVGDTSSSRVKVSG